MGPTSLLQRPPSPLTSAPSLGLTSHLGLNLPYAFLSLCFLPVSPPSFYSSNGPLMFPPQDLCTGYSLSLACSSPGVHLAHSLSPFRSLLSHLSEASVSTPHTLPIPLSCFSSLACSITNTPHVLFCTECQLHKNKDFCISSLCLYPRHWNVIGMLWAFSHHLPRE